MADFFRISGFVICLTAILFAGGCNDVALIESAGQLVEGAAAGVIEVGGFVFELLSSKKVSIKDVQVSYEGDAAHIKGKVKRMPRWCCRNVTGHVDIAVFDADGYLVNAFSVRFRPYFVPKHGTKSSSFQAPLPAGTGKGSVIRIAYHGTTRLAEMAGGQEGWMDCGNNIALLHEATGNTQTLELSQ